jgi:general secretion pathway protein A
VRPLRSGEPAAVDTCPRGPATTGAPPPRVVPLQTVESEDPATATAASATYERFYGLEENPFGASTGARFIYRSAAFDEVVQQLNDAFSRGEGWMVVTGVAGVGKTTLCRALVEQLGRRAVTAFLDKPASSLVGLLHDVLAEFGVRARSEAADARAMVRPAEMIAALQEFSASLATLHASPLIVVDDAQTWPLSVLDQLTIPGDDNGRRVPVLLAGRPELLAMLGSIDRPDGGGASGVRCGLEPLRADETANYVLHRLAVAGPQARLTIEEGVFGPLHLRTRGVPRLINLACDRALTRAAESGGAVVDRARILDAMNELELPASGLGAGWVEWLGRAPWRR